MSTCERKLLCQSSSELLRPDTGLLVQLVQSGCIIRVPPRGCRMLAAGIQATDPHEVTEAAVHMLEVLKSQTQVDMAFTGNQKHNRIWYSEA